MPSFDELLLSQLQASRAEGIDPAEGVFTGTRPGMAKAEPPNSFFANVYDNIATQPFYQLLGQVSDSMYPVEEGYDPLTKEELKGYEQYASYFRESRSRAQTEAMKQRLDSLQERRDRLLSDGGIGSDLVAELANPINYIGLGALRKGVGFAYGALQGAKAVAPSIAVEETLRSQIDPTTTREELVINTITGLAFGGILGGGVGMIGGMSTRKRMIDNYNSTMTRLDGDIPSVKTLETTEPSGVKTIYEATPTEVEAGIKSAFGLEKVTSRMTSYGRLVNKGFVAVEDFANALAGDFDLMFKRNEKGIPTEGSAYLRAGQWRGLAGDTIGKLDKIYNEYLGNGPDPLTIGNVNIPVTMRRVGQAVGIRPSDGLMTYQEFMEAIFRAHKRDKIEANNPFVERAAMTVREFFDKARDEGVNTGYLFSNKFQAKAVSRYTDRVAKFDREIAELDAKIRNNEKMTPNEMVQFRLLNEAKTRAEKRLARAKLSISAPPKRSASAKQINLMDNLLDEADLEIRNDQFLFHGTNVKDNGGFSSFIDENGNLVIKATDQSLSKRTTVSLSPDVEVAKDYATRIKGSGPYARKIQGAGIFQIDRKYLPDMQREAADEFTVAGDIVIPPNGWKFASLEKDTEQFARQFKTDIANTIRKFEQKSNEDLLKIIEEKIIDQEVRESKYEYEELDRGSGVGRVGSSYAQWEQDTFGDAIFDIDMYLAAQVLLSRNIPDNELVKIIEAQSNFGSGFVVESVNELKRLAKRFTDISPYSAADDLASVKTKQPEPQARSIGSLSDYEGPANEKFYLHRQWDIESILADEAGPQKLRQTLFDWFKANPPSTQELERVSALIDDLLEFKTRQNPKKVEMLAYLEKLGEEWKGLTPNQYDLLVKLRDELSTTPTFTKSQWDLLDKLAAAYRKEQGRLNYLNSDENIAQRVDQTIRNIIGEASSGEFQGGRPGGGSFRLSRTLDIPNELVADFVQRDVGALIRSYASQAGIGIEFARKFGTRDAEDAIDDMLLQVAREAKGSVQEINNLLEDIRNNAIELRDLTLGDAYARNPSSLSRDAAQALTSLAAVTQMGGAVITSLAEPAKQVMIHGIQRTLGFALKAMSDPKMFNQIAEETRRLTGEGMEVALGIHMQRHMEMGGLSAPGMNKVGRAFHNATRPLVNFAQGPYYIMNLLGPYTDIIKTYAGVMSSHYMLTDIQRAVKGQGGDKLISKLASYGLSLDDINKIAAQPLEVGQNLKFANTSKWDDPELVAKFSMAVAGEVRRTVVTAGPANKPNITQGFIGKGDNMREVALLRVPFQYMNYGLAALNKNLLSALQGREANAFAGVAAMVGMGYMVARLKSSDAAWEQMPEGEKILRAVNFSGVAGIITDLPNMIENATRGEYGVRPALGLPPAYGYSMYDDYSPYATAAGPGGGKIIDLYKLFVDDSISDREQAKIIRRMIPLNDLFYWKSLFNAGERQLRDQLY